MFDQRMIRICTSLSQSGYNVLLLGRRHGSSPKLLDRAFKQKRLFCFSKKGKLFYIEYNIRLFFYLLFANTDCFCAIDLDSILPNLLASKIRRKKRVYDAHELFCEMEEIIRRPAIYKFWKKIERYALPQFANGYTIGYFYKEEFKKMYGHDYEIIRNATILNSEKLEALEDKFILYQGAVNEGRCFEELIPAMKNVNAKLIICGNGNFFEQAQQLVKENKLEDKIEFKGYVAPAELKQITKKAYVGITLFESSGKSNFLSLANRFFDYMHSGVPQLAMQYPEYEKINSEFEIALLLKEKNPENIAKALNTLLADESYHYKLRENCIKAREVYNWQNEEKKLIHFYKKLFE